ncbi:hypothetical protein AAC387_Pa10g0784 [Persea americana]
MLSLLSLSFSLSTRSCSCFSPFPSPSPLTSLSFPLSDVPRLLFPSAHCDLRNSGPIFRWDSRQLLQRHLLIEISVKEHVGSGMQRKKQRQTNMIVLCDGHSQPVKEFEQFHVEGEIQPVLAWL